MQLVVAIIIKGLVFQVTDKEVLKEFEEASWQNYNLGDWIFNKKLDMVYPECFYFKNYNENINKVTLNYEPLIADPINRIISKCTCVGVV